MRILVYAHDYDPKAGGIPIYTIKMLRALHALGHSITLAVRDLGPEGRALDAEQPFETVRFRKPFAPPLYRVYAYTRLAALFRRVRPDVVWLPYWFRYASILAGITRRAGVPYAVTCHGNEVIFKRNPPGHSDRRLLRGYRGAARVFANSEDTRRRIVELGIEAENVQPGVDDRFFAATRAGAEAEALRARLGLAGRRVLLTVARVVPNKGIDTVIRSLPAVVRRVPDVAYVVAGTGPSREALERLAEENGVRDLVRFAGHVPHDELAAYYGLAEIYVMPTRNEAHGKGRLETFGMSFAEAAAAGLPVIATNHGGVRDIIVDGETGVVVDPTDVGAVGVALERLLAEPALARKLGEAGRKRVYENFRWPDLATRMARSLEAAVAAIPTRSS